MIARLRHGLRTGWRILRGRCIECGRAAYTYPSGVVSVFCPRCWRRA